ncbi:MAG TPA: GntR family transcriptional regulator [Clostridiales bacterium]|nr:GntR family transcriptional regulator [Clostridiales bacterium]
MRIVISNAVNQPIYEQIYKQIKNSILSEELKAGDLLPSIRSLAKDLRISVITTKRAYDELEKDGYIDVVAAKGCYVAEKNLAFIREAHLKQMEDHLRSVRELAVACDLTETEIWEMYRLLDKDE